LNDIIAMLLGSKKPLIICDVDEVVLEFIVPFQNYLASIDHRLHADSFHLDGNVRRIADDVPATKGEVGAFLEAFFSTQDKWQTPARGASAALAGLKDDADIVFLTSMPPRHQMVRRTVLDLHGFPYPIIATEEAKGPIAGSLIGNRSIPSVFLDDIARNLHSVHEHAPSCLLINLMANEAFKALAPDPGEGVHKARDWTHAGELIRAHFGTS